MSVKVLMLGPSLDSRGGMATFARAVLDVTNPACKDGLSFSYFPTVCPGSKLHKLFYFVRSYAAFSKAVETADIVHINFSLGASLPRKMAFAKRAKQNGKKLILHSHSSELENAINDARPIVRQQVIPFLSMADAVIVLTNYWKETLSSLGIEKTRIYVVPNGVEIPLDKRGGVQRSLTEKRVPNVLYLGRLEQEKGIEDLLDAVSSIQENNLRIKLVLAGSGDSRYVDYLQSKVRNLLLDVDFLGWIDGQEKKQALINADIFVLPSHREVLPISLLEAMASGVAPIATRVGAVPEVIEDGVNGLLCIVGDTESLASSLQRMCTDLAFRDKCANAAISTVESRYSIDSMMDCLHRIYEKVLIDGK